MFANAPFATMPFAAGSIPERYLWKGVDNSQTSAWALIPTGSGDALVERGGYSTGTFADGSFSGTGRVFIPPTVVWQNMNSSDNGTWVLVET